MKHTSVRPVELEVSLPNENVRQREGRAAYRNLCEKSDQALCQLLSACHESLRILTVSDIYPFLGSLPLLPLKNLTKLTITFSYSDPGLRSSNQNFLFAIDYDQIVPNLEEIEIVDDENASQFFLDRIREHVVRRGRPGGSKSEVRCYFCGTARRLRLNLKDRGLDLRPLKLLAPNILTLELHITPQDGGHRSPDLLSFTQIFQLWPQLEQLQVTGRVNNCFKWNYDADFCGIHEEEVMRLEEKDKGFLRKVHIVPTKPSLLTMQSESSPCFCEVQVSN